MKIYSFYHVTFFLFLAALLSSCGTAPSMKQADISSVPPELLQKSYLYEVVRHLYRWYLDESEIERIVEEKKIIFWVRGLEPELDSGDRSIFGEIFLPQLNISVRVKKADYLIEEMGVEIKNPGFKITQILRSNIPADRRLYCRVVNLDMKEMCDYLFRTRNQQDFPDAKMIEHLRQAVCKQVAKEEVSLPNLPVGDRIIHLASLSPVANETWLFWEDGHRLFYFASDIDLVNPAVWKHETMLVRVFDLDNQVVVSPSEVPGSNRFLTRYQVSRALYNCIVLGRRINLPPSTAAAGVSGDGQELSK